MPFIGLCLFVLLMFSAGVNAHETYCQANTPSSTTNGDGTLELVVATVRHGDRTPADATPAGYTDDVQWNCSLNSLSIFDDSLSPSADPSILFRKVYLPGREVLPGNCFFGQLTEKGSQQHLQLGKILRERYIENTPFLPQNLSDLSHDEIWIRTTDVPRVQQSVQSLISALYPLENRLAPSSSPDKDVPVPVIRTMDIQMENMFANPTLCPRLNEIYEEIAQTAPYLEYLDSVQPLNDYLNQIFGTNVSISDITDIIRARRCHGFALPGDMNETVADAIGNASTILNQFLMNTTESIRLGIGSFLLEEIAQIDSYIAGDSPSKFVLFGGHDSSIWPLKLAFGYEEPVWPPYLSSIFIELWNVQSVYQVQIIVNGVPRVVPGCTQVGPCDYDTFKSALTPYLPVDFEQECEPQYSYASGRKNRGPKRSFFNR